MGRLDEARDHLTRSLAITRDAGDRAMEARTLAHLALVHRATGHEQEAEDVFAEARALEHRFPPTLTLYEEAMSSGGTQSMD